jgi:hypothetical protein
VTLGVDSGAQPSRTTPRILNPIQYPKATIIKRAAYPKWEIPSDGEEGP